MKKIYKTPTVEQVVFTVEEIMAYSNGDKIELPDHEWSFYVLPKVELD